MDFVHGLISMTYTTSSMKNFVISDLERFSGIRAHTVRTWEQRYNFLTPQRSNGIRYYSLPELKFILDIALLNQNGYKISSLSGLSAVEIEARIMQLKNSSARQRAALNELIIGMYEMDIERIEATLDKCFLSWPAEEVMREVIYCFLKKTELLWTGNRLTEEHLVVTIMRKKLLWAIEKTATNVNVAKTVVLFLSDIKQLDLGLLYMNYLLTHNGSHVIYMGNDVSISNLKAIIQKVKPQLIYTHLAQKNNLNVQELSSFMLEHIPGSCFVVTDHSDVLTTSAQPANVRKMSYENALLFLAS